MSIKTLTKLVKPPKTPTEPGVKSKWPEIEAKLGTALPTDYKEFINKYGSGLFAQFFIIFNPFSPSGRYDLFGWFKDKGEQYRNDHEEDEERFPYDVFPEPGGLLLWGCDENGNFYFWLTKGKPDEWAVAVDEVRGLGFIDYDIGMTEYLADVLQKERPALAGDYPKKENLVFEPAIVMSNAALLNRQFLDAVESGALDSVHAMLDAGVNANNETALRFAVGKSLKVAKLLLERGADVNKLDNGGTSILYSAASSGNLRGVKFLLDAGADPNLYGPGGSELWPLRCVGHVNLTEIADILLNAGANPNMVDSNGRTPIFKAAGYRNIKTLQSLLKAGADLSIKDQEGQTVLASVRKDTDPAVFEVIEILEKAGAPE